MNVSLWLSRLSKMLLISLLAVGFVASQVACRGGVPPENNSNGNTNTNDTNTNNSSGNTNNSTGNTNNSTGNNNNSNTNKPPKEASIKDVQDPSSGNYVGDGNGVILKGVIATTTLFRVNDNLSGFFITSPNSPDTYGGVMVVVGKDDLTEMKIGDVLDIEGQASEYFFNTQVSAQASRGGFVTKKGENNAAAIRVVEVANPADVAATPSSKEKPDESKAEPYEGMLIELKNVTVVEEADQFGAWKLEGGVLVEDTFFRYRPKKGDKIASVKGVLQYTFDQYRLLPRSFNDIAGAKPECDSSTPCRTGQKCNEAVGKCEFIVCSADGDCNQGEVCKTDTQQCEKPLQTATIQQLQDPSAQGALGDGDPVELKGIVAVSKLYSVSANLQGFFATDINSQGKYNGVLVVVGKDWKETVEIGDEIDVKGKKQEYFKGTQVAVNLTQGDTLTKTGNNKKDMIKATEVSATDIPSTPADKNNPDSSPAEPYEGVLVELKDVVVDDVPNKFGEWTVAGGSVLVDDSLFKHTPAKDDKISVLRGVILYSFDKFRLLPRSADDVKP